MKHNYRLLCCSVALSICVSQLFAQQVTLKSVSSGLQAYHPIRKWGGLDLRSVIMRPEFITGLGNTATGLNALINANEYTVGNTADGYVALTACTYCSYNTAVGSWALNSLTTGNNNTAIGAQVLTINNGSGNTGVGASALIKSSTGSSNTALGANTLASAVGESNSVAIGYYSMYNSNSPTGYNTAIGSEALGGVNNLGGSNGFYNVVVGASAMYANNTGYENTVSGYEAMYTNSSGSFNTVSGMLSMYTNTTGSSNVTNGFVALYGNTIGSSNTAIGFATLTSNTTGSNNTALGDGANTGSGALTNAMALGSGATVSSSNQVVVGSSSVTSIGGYANWTNFSDGRYKKSIQQNVPGLSFINKLNPVTYTLDINGIEAKLHENDKAPSGKNLPSRLSYLDDPVMKQAMQEKSAITYTGFVAQDVEKAADSVGFTFSGIDKPKDVNQSFYGLRYGDFVVPLVKAVQELSASSNSKDSAINVLQGKFDSLQTQVSELRALLLAKNTTAMSGASLDQNAPNPFTGSTVIGYSLPKGVSSAQMQITDATGKVLALIPLSSGDGKNMLTANVSGYASGTYSYSLIVNGKLAGTRQMISIR